MAQLAHPVCVWDFTAPLESDSKHRIMRFCWDHCKKWCFQIEQGESGYLHFQGRFSLKTKQRLSTLKSLFENDKAHFSITSNENRDNNFYVSKEDTREDGPWDDKAYPMMYIPRQIREITQLYPWQQTILDDRLTWNKRTINIVLDTEGNIGKSILKTYIGVYQYGRTLPYSNDYRDIMRMVMDTPKKPLYIIDLPRALRKEQQYQFYSAVETIKDGYAFDDRYKFREEFFDCPNIWIFTNSIPDYELLSKDRWVFWRVIENRLERQASFYGATL